ncbi:MAG: hypothetical protein FJ090_04010 [Deltaproteobacteria bacterium]|nr:hypothetical protein [Deltaproteobacteria bacterium]
MLWMVLVLGCGTEEAAPPPARKAGGGRHVSRDERRAAAVEPSDAEEEDVPVLNRAPVIERFTVSPGQPTVIDTLVVKADASDPDGQDVDLEYRWEVDGQKVAVRGAELELGDYSRGQRVTVALTVSDGALEKSLATEPIEIVNAPPQFRTDPAKIRTVEGFQVVAEDPDGDAITWSLEGAPPQMSIDPRGVLHWKGSETDAAGSYRVKIKASDPGGEVGTIELPVDVSAGSKAAQAVEKPG